MARCCRWTASLGRGANAGATSTDPSARRDAVTSRYSAIAGDVALGFQPRPLYHGMLLAQQFAGARMVPGQLEAAGVNLTAYATLRDDAMQIALINKDAAHDATIAVSSLQGYSSGRFMRLSAPALDSRHGIVLEGTEGAAGHPVSVDAHGICRFAVPRGSAAWVRLNRSV